MFEFPSVVECLSSQSTTELHVLLETSLDQYIIPGSNEVILFITGLGLTVLPRHGFKHSFTSAFGVTGQ